MTISSTSKNFGLFVIFGAFFLLPTFTHAATDLREIQSQYQLLMQRFESFKKSNATGSSTAKETKRPSKAAVDLTCMATAVATREAAMTESWTAFNNNISDYLEDRKTALVAAWNIESAKERNTAVRSAWSAWKKNSRTAHDDLRKSRKAAWDTFKKTAKESCKETVPKEEGLETATKDTLAL